MTIHSAKGLEYSLVFIVGLEEGLFPITSYSSLDNDIDEERRLFYVGSTRAMQQLVLSYAKKRMKYGYEIVLSSKSRFLDEIPLELLEFEGDKTNIFQSNRISSPRQPVQKRNGDINYQSTSTIKIGDNVHHKVFGNGRVIQISGLGDTQQISIRFVGNVVKKLMKKYANLSKID